MGPVWKSAVGATPEQLVDPDAGLSRAVADASYVLLRDKVDSNNILADTDFIDFTAAYTSNQPGVITVFGGTTSEKHTVGNAPVGTIGGGYDNELGDGATAGTISGGAHHTMTGSHGTIGGGSFNVVTTGGYATVAGGTANSATGIQATAGGGGNNVASGQSATVAGGSTNTASAQEATAAGGNNLASGQYSVALGKLNQATATAAVATGYNCKATRPGQRSHASGAFSVRGDAQVSDHVMRIQTTNATPAVLATDGAAGRLDLANDTTWAFSIMVVARRTDADNESAAYKLEGCIDRQADAASTALVGTVTTTVLGEDTAAWDVAATADTTNGGLAITVTGEASKTIRWVAKVTLVEVSG